MVRGIPAGKFNAGSAHNIIPDKAELEGTIRTLTYDTREKSPGDSHHFADMIVADALYCKSTWINEVLSIGMNAVVRVKDERLHIVKDALALFKCREADKNWTVKKGT